MGLMSMLSKPHLTRVTAGAGRGYAGHTPAPARQFARGGYEVPGGGGPDRYAGRGAAHTSLFARGGMADPEDHEPEVPAELKLAAYELLECLDSSKYSGPDGHAGRAEAFASKLLAFVRLSDELPHEEGEHEEEPDEEPGEVEEFDE